MEFDQLKEKFIQACSLQEAGNNKAALNIYKDLERYLPDAPMIHFNMGLANFDMEDFEKAEAHYLTALHGSPDDPDIHYNLGLNHRRLGKLKEAAKSFSLATSPGDISIDAIYNQALCHQDLDELDQAAELYQLVLARDPHHQSSLNNYAYLCHKKNDLDTAGELYTKALSLDPDNQKAAHMLNAINGTTVDKAPLEYIESIFDGYADTFEDKLVNDLEYRTPLDLWDSYRKLFPEAKNRRCLDLGCGTGLAAKTFLPACSEIIGVDLSGEILRVAAEKNIYKSLFKDDILTFLKKECSMFNLVIAADVFAYMGNLKNIMAACAEKLTPEGVICFSVEESGADEFILKSTGRFGHSKHYIECLGRESGLTLLFCRRQKLRLDREEWIYGFLFILQKTSHSTT